MPRFRAAPARARPVGRRPSGGLSIAEAIWALPISPATVSRDRELARHWLLRELGLAGG